MGRYNCVGCQGGSPLKSPVTQTPEINPKYASFKLMIKPSKIHRWGVYAAEDIPARRKIMEYTGERISRKETRRRSEEQGRMIYLFTLDNYWTLDGAVGGSGAQYINHCCDPNIKTVIQQRPYPLYEQARDSQRRRTDGGLSLREGYRRSSVQVRVGEVPRDD